MIQARMVGLTLLLWALAPLIVGARSLIVRQSPPARVQGGNETVTGDYRYEITEMASIFYPSNSTIEIEPRGHSFFSFAITSFRSNRTVATSVCQVSWIPPSYPRSWIECTGNPDLLFRFYNVSSSPQAQFGIEIMEIRHIPDQTSSFSVSNVAFLVSSNNRNDSTSYLFCMGAAAGKPTTCRLNAAVDPLGLPKVIHLVPESRAVHIDQGFSLHDVVIKNNTVPVGGTLCEIEFTFVDHATQYLPPVPSDVKWDTSAGANRTEVTCRGTWLCSSHFAGVAKSSFGFNSAACDSSNLAVRLRAPAAGMEDIHLELTRTWPLMLNELFGGSGEEEGRNGTRPDSVPARVDVRGEAHLTVGRGLSYISNGTGVVADAVAVPLTSVNVTDATKFCGNVPEDGCPYPYSSSSECWETDEGMYTCGPTFSN